MLINDNKSRRFIFRHWVAAGFTLLELLVVIAIIGVLASIAVINLNNTRQNVKDTAMLGLMKEVVPLVDFCVANNYQVCSDCQSGVLFRLIDPGDNICQGQLWPVPISGWHWGSFSTSGFFGLGSSEWMFAAARDDDSSKNIYCANFTGETKCIFDYHPYLDIVQITEVIVD